MARRGWSRSIFLAAFGAAGSAAAQLGVGYGLGIISWLPPDGSDAAASGAWSASLGWTTFISATSVVIGAAVGGRAVDPARAGRVHRAARGLVLALAASIGGLVALPLVAVPASRADIDGNFAPHLLAVIYGAVGVVVGLVVAVLALVARSIGTNVMATVGWLWALAIVAVSGGIAAGRLDYAPLGVWKFTNAGPVWFDTYYVPGGLILLGGGLLVGGLAAYPSAARGDGRLGVTLSGAMGPALVVLAYELAAPTPGKAPFEQLSALHTAPFMVAAGLLGSLLVASVGGVSSKPRRRSSPTSFSVPLTPIDPPPAAEYVAPAPTGRAQPARTAPLPAPSPHAVSATASVPASARVAPEHRRTG